MNKHLEAQRPLTAGLFDPPPEMARDVLDWMLRTYCGHVLALTDKKLAALSDILGPAKAALAEMYMGGTSIPDTGEKLIEKVRRLQFGQTLTIPLFRLKSDFTLEKSYIAIKCVEDAYFPEEDKRAVSLEGLRQFPDNKGENAYMFAEGKRIKFEEHLFFAKRLKDVVYKAMWRLSDVIQRFEDSLDNAKDASNNKAGVEVAVQNLRQMRSYCLNFTNQPKEYTSTAKKVFPLNLTGWRYLRPDEMHKLKGVRGWDKVTCVLDFKGHNTRGGQWNVHLKELQVDVAYAVPSAVEQIQEGVAKIQRTLGHEMRHVGQDALKEIKGLKDEAGLPSKNIRTPGFDPSGYKLLNNKPWYSSGQRDHAVRDVEFYTRLSDEIDRFIRHIIRLRGWQPDFWKSEADMWVNGKFGEALSGKEGFFYTLKVREPLKWKKAVGEFYKAVEPKISAMSPAQSKKAAAARVASRWMSAGIFAPPPEMVRALSEWMLELYCSDVLYETLLELHKYKSAPQDLVGEVKRALSEMQDTYAKVGLTLEQLEPNEVAEFRTYSMHSGDPRLFIGVDEVKDDANKHFDARRKLQEGKRPPDGTKALVFMREHSTPAEVSAKVKKILEYSMKDLEEELFRRSHADVDVYAELNRIRDMCLKYTAQPKSYKNPMVRRFPVNLSGWGYTKNIAPEDLAQRLTSKGWTTIKGILDFKGHVTRGGQWDYTKRELQVDKPFLLPKTGAVFQTYLVKLKSTLEHELRHVGQDILRDVLGLHEDAGLPSKNIRTPGPRKEHALLDQEFYTRLGDELSMFLDHLRNQSEPQQVWSQMAHDWVNKKETFTKLKAKEPLKWKKAVAEFYKAVGNQVENMRKQA